MYRRTKHTTLVLFGIIALVAACIGYWYVHYATMTQAQNYSLARQEAEAYAESKKNEQDLQKTYTQTQVGRAKISGYVVSEDKLVSFIESLEQIGKLADAEVSLSSIVSDEMDGLKKGELGHIELKIDAKGSWKAIMTTLSLVENLPYGISSSQERLSYDSEGKDWNLRMNLKVLSIK